MNGIVWSFQDDPDAFEPLFSITTYGDDSREYLDAEMWAHGFMQGIALCREDWQPLYDDAAAVAALRPLYLLGADEITKEEEN